MAVGIRFKNVPNNRESKAYGPFEYAELTYADFRVDNGIILAVSHVLQGREGGDPIWRVNAWAMGEDGWPEGIQLGNELQGDWTDITIFSWEDL